MPKGARNTDAQARAAAAAAGALPEVAADPGTKVETKSAPVSRKVMVGTGFNIDDLIALDSDGVDLVFEQTDKFLPLEPGIVDRLSRLNRTRYGMAREFHDAWRGDEHAAFVERFRVDRQMVGSATDKLKATAASGMHTHWFRPDRLNEARSRGYRMLSADEADTYLGPTEGHHEIGRLGQSELVLMGIPEELHQKRLAEKTRRNNEMAGAYKNSAMAEMRQAGGQPFESADESRDRSHAWQDVPSED